jgi:hypothetical protein
LLARGRRAGRRPAEGAGAGAARHAWLSRVPAAPLSRLALGIACAGHALPRLAVAAVRPHGAGPPGVGAGRLRRRAGRPRSVPGAPTPACTPATRWCTWTRPVDREPFSLGARHQPLPAAGHRGAVVPAGGGRAFTRRNSARGRRYRYVLLESAVRPALESGPLRLGLPAAGRRGDARGGRSPAAASTTSAPSAPRSARRSSPVKTLRDAGHRPARRLLALRLRRQRLPAPHGAQHHGLPGGGGQRHARRPAGCGRCSQPTIARGGRAHLRGDRACTSVGPVPRCAPRPSRRTPAQLSTGCPGPGRFASGSPCTAPASRSAA